MTIRRWLVFAFVLMAGTARGSDIPAELSLHVGESRLLSVDIKRAALGNGKVVSLATPERGQLLLFGRALAPQRPSCGSGTARANRCALR
ncbi:MAG: pilus assembly protein N-terminal domain-containing protein [Proteobacteria bacterium]|nr:pilus assembly protein N-terminal domain-containing protein [Pseudomonadota bacterium]